MANVYEIWILFCAFCDVRHETPVIFPDGSDSSLVVVMPTWQFLADVLGGMCNGLKPLASFGINCSTHGACVYIYIYILYICTYYRSIFDQKRRLHRFIMLFLVWVRSITDSVVFTELSCLRSLSNPWRSGSSNRKWKRCSRWARWGWPLSSLISLGAQCDFQWPVDKSLGGSHGWM